MGVFTLNITKDPAFFLRGWWRPKKELKAEWKADLQSGHWWPETFQ